MVLIVHLLQTHVAGVMIFAMPGLAEVMNRYLFLPIKISVSYLSLGCSNGSMTTN